MTTTLSQTAIAAAITSKVAGSADNILAAAIGADKASGKLAAQVRALFSSPATVVSATLAQALASLEAKVTTKGVTDSEAWARIANNIATNVRNQWNKLGDDVKPAVCYIALNRTANTAVVHVMQKPTKAELKAAIGTDQKAYNAYADKLFGKAKPVSGKEAPAAAAGKVSVTEKNAPRIDTVAALFEQTRGLSLSDLERLQTMLAADIAARHTAALAKAESKGASVTAHAKHSAKSGGVTQARAKNAGPVPKTAPVATAGTNAPVNMPKATKGAKLAKAKPDAALTFKPSLAS